MKFYLRSLFLPAIFILFYSNSSLAQVLSYNDVIYVAYSNNHSDCQRTLNELGYKCYKTIEPIINTNENMGAFYYLAHSYWVKSTEILDLAKLNEINGFYDLATLQQYSSTVFCTIDYNRKNNKDLFESVQFYTNDRNTIKALVRELTLNNWNKYFCGYSIKDDVMEHYCFGHKQFHDIISISEMYDGVFEISYTVDMYRPGIRLKPNGINR